MKRPAEGAVTFSYFSPSLHCPLLFPEVLQPLPGGNERGCAPSFIVFSPNLISGELNSDEDSVRWRDEAQRAQIRRIYAPRWESIHPHSRATEAISITWRCVSHFSFLSSVTENDCY